MMEMIWNEGKTDAAKILSQVDFSEAKIIFCKRFDQHSHIWNLSPHSHAYLELLFFLRGEARIAAGEQVISSTSYDMIVYLPHHQHQEFVDLNKTQEIVCIWANVGDLPPIREGAFRLRDKNRVLEWLFIQLEQEYRKNSIFSQKLTRCYLEAIIQNTLRQLAQGDSESAADSIDRARVFIKSHFTQPISVATLAELCHVSPSYLQRIFHKQLGMSPVQYITSLRVKEAEYLLNSSSLSIMAIAEHCGFGDPRYFSRLFKKQTGLSPSQYKAKCLKPN